MSALPCNQTLHGDCLDVLPTLIAAKSSGRRFLGIEIDRQLRHTAAMRTYLMD